MLCCYGRIWQNLCLTWVFHFCKFFTNLHFNLEPNYIVRKPIICQFQWYILCTEILSTSMQESNTFLLKIRPFKPLGQWGKQPWNPPFPLKSCGLHEVHQCLGQVPTQSCQTETTARSIHTLPHNYATKSPMVIMGCPKFTTKTAPSSSMITPPYNTPVPWLTPLTIPKGLRIHSAVLP